MAMTRTQRSGVRAILLDLVVVRMFCEDVLVELVKTEENTGLVNEEGAILTTFDEQ